MQIVFKSGDDMIHNEIQHYTVLNGVLNYFLPFFILSLRNRVLK